VRRRSCACYRRERAMFPLFGIVPGRSAAARSPDPGPGQVLIRWLRCHVRIGSAAVICAAEAVLRMAGVPAGGRSRTARCFSGGGFPCCCGDPDRGWPALAAGRCWVITARSNIGVVAGFRSRPPRRCRPWVPDCRLAALVARPRDKVLLVEHVLPVAFHHSA
jgi:hypothetical protein